MRSERIITCRRCNGAGHYYQKGDLVKCDECGGAGQLLEEYESAVERGGHCGLVLLGVVVSLTGLLGGLVTLGLQA